MEHLFVYGTLAPGKPNAHVLADLKGTWQPATVRGRFLQAGWGAALGFPGLVLDEPNETVSGLLFSSEALAEFWPRLDAFEGEGYARVPVTVQLADGSLCEASIYTVIAH